jgi:hypothetical protein
MMGLRKNSALLSLCAVLALSAGLNIARASATNDIPDYNEVYNLIRMHAAGLTKAELDQAAVRGLISALGQKVSLVTSNGTATTGAQEGVLIARTNLFGNKIAYLRVTRVGEDLAKVLRETYRALAGTNQLNGLVLDLRYADGADYGAAVAAADLFVKREQPLLDWGTGMVKSTEKSEVLATPLAVLVNAQTVGAAEALAAMLRITDAALILGSRTGGAAFISQDFPLESGGRLRIATAPIELGDGTRLSTDGVKPDLPVSVNAASEKAYFANSYPFTGNTNLLAGAGLSPTNGPNGTNRTPRHVLFNEAELVREHRAGLNVNDDSDAPPDGASAPGQSVRGGAEEAARPVVQDPVLARALDLLTGLAVVRQSRT